MGSILLIYSVYNAYKFKNSPLEKNIQERIQKKYLYLQSLAYTKFGITRKVPLIISDKLPAKFFGIATYSKKTGKIEIYLNKNRFKESLDYMIDDVLPHEYAHAIMFILGDFSDENAGHSKKWQDICIALEGKKCNRFVNNNDIIFDKTNLF